MRENEGAFHGNLFEDKPNEKWKELSKIYLRRLKNKTTLEDLPGGGEGPYGSMEGTLQSIVHSDGRTVTGIIRGGKICSGDIVYSNGNQYTGEIRELMAHGSGKMEYVNRDLYTGRFFNDNREGVGELVTENGHYRGSFKNDVFHGRGVFMFKNGSIYNGGLMILE